MKKYFLLSLLAVFGLFANAAEPQRDGNRDGEYYFEWDEGAYPSNMTFTAIINLDGTEVTGTDLELAVFETNGDCRGRGRLSGDYYAFLNHYFLFLTVNGENGKQLTEIKLYDHSTNQEIFVTCDALPIAFVADGTVGDPGTPYVFDLTSYTPSYTLTVSVSPDGGGTVTGGGTYEAGTNVTLTATANTGYDFQFWTKDGDVVSDEESFTVTVTEDAEYVANFASNMYLITATASPSYAGTVTGAGGYTYHQQCTLTATANTDEGYTFYRWTLNGGLVGEEYNPVYSFTVEASGDYVAEFIEQSGPYTIAATCDPAEAGSITGTGNTFMSGDECTLTATANGGYTFQYWATADDDFVTDENPFVFTVTGNATYKAVFMGGTPEVFLITATASPSYAGTVTGGGGYHAGETCELTATAESGYTFYRWTLNGGLVGEEYNPVYSFTVEASGDYVAEFVEQAGGPYTITLAFDPTSASVAYTLSGAGTYNAGTECTLTATLIEGMGGYEFLYWADENDDMVSEDNPYNFTVTADANLKAVFSQETYMITATASPSEGGTVTGFGGFTYNQLCTLVATANEGYQFVNWTLNGSEVSNDATYAFNVTESRDLVANFALDVLPVYTVTALVDPEEAGTVEGAGSFEQGATCTLTATAANEGYDFQYWADENGDMVSEDNPFEFTVTGDVTYTAMFSTNIYLITVTANPSVGGTVTGGGGFTWGTSCTLIAEAAEGYTFLNWTLNGGVVSTDAQFTFDVYQSGDYVANFTLLPTYTITATVNPEEAGTVTGAGNYLEGAECTLEVTPNVGYTFVNWTLDDVEVSAELSFTFNVTADAEYVANFTQDEYEIQIPVTVENGEVVIEGGIDGTNMFHYGDMCTLTAIPAPGFYFVGWEENGVMVSTENPWTFEVTGPAYYTPIFMEYNTYQITVVANPNAGGTVDGGGIFHENDVITLTATVNEGYTFINWTLNGEEVSTDLSFDITVTENATYVANYVQQVFYVTVIETPAEGGDVYGIIPGGYYLYGHTCVLQALPNPGYSFDHWAKDGVTVTTDAYYTFDVYANTVMTAYFNHDQYTITAVADPVAGGTATVSNSNPYFGQSCTLTATANTGYTFVNWTKDGEQVATTASYTFTVEESANFVAHFSQNIYTIELQTNPAGVAHVFIQNGGNGQFTYGQDITLKVGNINNGYNFVSWTKNGTVVSTDPTCTVTVTGNATYVANFDIDMFTITATAVPSIGGYVAGAGEFAYGESCTLTATARPGYTFLRWMKNGVQVSTDANYTFTVTANASFVAQFSSRAVTINATATEGGVVTGAGLYDYGEMVTLNATPNTDYVFVSWTENGAIVSTEAELTFVAEKDRNLVANFTYYTDIDENTNVSITMFPNPVSTEMTVMTNMSSYQLDIYTVTGALVRSMNNCNGTATVNVEDLSNGTYIIRLHNDNVVETRRFVKE